MQEELSVTHRIGGDVSVSEFAGQADCNRAVAAGVERFFTYEKAETRKAWAEITGFTIEVSNVEQTPLL